MVIVVPAVLLTLTMVFQAMEYYIARQAAETAATQAVDAARVAGGGDGTGTAEANNVLAQLGSPVQHVNVTVTTSAGVVTATVSGTPYQLVPAPTFHVSATASGPLDAFGAAP